MPNHDHASIFIGDTVRYPVDEDIHAEYVSILGEQYYRIKNYDAMKPFFMSVVSSSNPWLFISSTGGLSAGRVSAEQALFPYYTEDKLAENYENTGNKSIFLVRRGGRTSVWEPLFRHNQGSYRIERNLYKNVPGMPAPYGSRSENGGPVAQALPFADDFEVGDFAGWIVERAGGRREVSGQTAANGTSYSYREFESLGSHYSGVYTTLGDVRPGYFGFWVRPGNTSHNTGYFAVTSPDRYESIFFFARDSGRFYVNPDMGGDESYPYQANTWYFIEFRNVDFAAKTFDYWVNGAAVATGIRLRHPTSATSAWAVHLYNWTRVLRATRGSRWPGSAYPGRSPVLLQCWESRRCPPPGD